MLGSAGRGGFFLSPSKVGKMGPPADGVKRITLVSPARAGNVGRRGRGRPARAGSRRPRAESRPGFPGPRARPPPGGSARPAPPPQIRHGQGFHNVAGEQDFNSYRSEEFLDAHLTEVGWKQALGLREALRGAGAAPDLVVVSPLTRTLETAAGCLGGAALGGGAGAAGALMLAQAGEEGRRTACPGFLPGAAPFLAHEYCREGHGRHPCDRRSPLRVVRPRFPGVAEWAVETDEDTWFDPAVRESPEHLVRRATAFLAWLRARGEAHIAVVSHAEFLGALCYVLGHMAASQRDRDEVTLSFKNCEMRTVEIRGDPAHPGHGVMRPTGLKFPGGSGAAREGPVPWPAQAPAAAPV